ncbi:MAG: ester cyclase [Roseicyclus sp.]
MAGKGCGMRDVAGQKRAVAAHLAALADGADPATIFAPDAVAEIAHPWGRCEGPAAIGAFYADLRAGLPDMEWRPEILIGGENHPDERSSVQRYSPLVGAWGHLQGTFRRPILGIPPTDGAVHLRISQVHHLNEAGQIRRSWILPDLLDLMDQAQVYPLPPMTGARGMWPGPKGGRGVRLHETDAQAGDAAMGRVLDMHHALNTHPGQDVRTLTMHHWTPDFMYYAAGGIGICRAVEGFRRDHQVPFRVAFPDRSSHGHFVRIGDGRFALTGGRLYATHRGEYLGIPATGRSVHLDVMDFYHFDEAGLITENWLPFDILGMAHQMGVDLLARVRDLPGGAHHAP